MKAGKNKCSSKQCITFLKCLQNVSTHSLFVFQCFLVTHMWVELHWAWFEKSLNFGLEKSMNPEYRNNAPIHNNINNWYTSKCTRAGTLLSSFHHHHQHQGNAVFWHKIVWDRRINFIEGYVAVLFRTCCGPVMPVWLSIKLNFAK